MNKAVELLMLSKKGMQHLKARNRIVTEDNFLDTESRWVVLALA